MAGQNFSIHYELNNVSDSVYAAVYGQQLIFQFDPALLEFVSAESMKAGQTVASVTTDGLGQISIRLVSPSGTGTANGDTLKLTWQAKALDQPGGTRLSVSLSQATITDGSGGESDVNGAIYSAILMPDKSLLTAKIVMVQAMNGTSYSASTWSALQAALQTAIDVNANLTATQAQVDTAAIHLQTAINALQAAGNKARLELNLAEAQSKATAATIGVRWGQYAQSAVNALNVSISSAMSVYKDENATQMTVDQAALALNTALQTFAGSMNAKASIGDMSIISAHYGLTSGARDEPVPKV